MTDGLRRFQSWEMLRIGACDLLDLYDLPAVTRQLSNLADSLVRAALKIVAGQCGMAPDDLVVIAMGKLGGRELNYSSDIDLLFITDRDPADVKRVAERFIEAVARSTAEGFLYRVDLRLRPWGTVGSLVSTLPGFVSYLKKDARLWETQALIKARPIAGNLALGRTFLQEVKPYIFSQDKAALRDEVFEMKRQVESQLRRSGKMWGEVKLGEGSIRDVEFTAQFLQLAHGLEMPEIQSGNTLDALVRLAAAGLLSVDEHRVLAEGYVFLRTVEHFLQMMHYRQVHILPDDNASMAQLALRLGFAGAQPERALVERYEQHRTAIRTIFMRYLGSSVMDTKQPFSNPADEARLDVHRHLDRMAPSYAETYSAAEIARHAELAGRLGGENLVEVDAVPGEAAIGK